MLAGLVAGGVEGDCGVDKLLMGFRTGGEGDEPFDGHFDGGAAGGSGVEPVFAVGLCRERRGGERLEIVRDVVEGVAFVEVID